MDFVAYFEAYGLRWPQEVDVVRGFVDFINRHEDCLLRSCRVGHLTASALVATPQLDAVLLHHHRKLDMWIQLGGHADGDASLHRVAMREAEEESGLRDLRLLDHPTLTHGTLGPLPFDVDIHRIPARAGEPEHLHFDVRYVAIASRDAPLVMSDESRDLRWFSLAAARAVTSEASMHRQFDKVERLRREGGRGTSAQVPG